MGCGVDYGSFYVNYTGAEDTSSTDFDKRINDSYLTREFDSITFSQKENSFFNFFSMKKFSFNNPYRSNCFF